MHKQPFRDAPLAILKVFRAFFSKNTFKWYGATSRKILLDLKNIIQALFYNTRVRYHILILSLYYKAFALYIIQH